MTGSSTRMKGLCAWQLRLARHPWSKRDTAYLLISNSKLALRLLVVLGKALELLDGLILNDRDGKLDV